MSFSLKTRQESINYLKNHSVDVLIIGGGITGAGLALQTAASGMTTALVEMQDFAEGTSSRSTKLVHGGIRYLKTFDVEVVSDTVSERANVQKIAPHIPKPNPMLLPIYDEPNNTFSLFSLKVAMDLYDNLAHVTGTKYENRVLTKEEVLEVSPHLNQDKLLGGGIYLDFKNNDARLVIENIKKAHEDGAHLLSKTKVIGLIYDDHHKISGVHVEDVLTGETYDIHADVVVNTTGPWSDTIRGLSKDQTVTNQMRPTKGVHLVVDYDKLPVTQPVYFDTGLSDGRMVFVIPRENKTYFGTTDTDYTGDLMHPTVTQEDVDYLLKVVNNRFPKRDITLEDIEASWAGLRPLLSGNAGSDYNGGSKASLSDESLELVIQSVKDFEAGIGSKESIEQTIKKAKTSSGEKEVSASSVSRGSSLDVTKDGLVTLAGGKITDYRLMAEGALNLIASILKENFGREYHLVDSKRYPVSGGEFDPTKVEEMTEVFTKLAIEQGLSKEEASDLANLYGANINKVLSYDKVDFMGLTKAESMSLMYALEEEMTLTPVDYVLRRTNYLLFKRDRLEKIKEAIINAMSQYFEWTQEEVSNYTKELDNAMSESFLSDLKIEG
ncbi:type 1 glycerol-3-phosphate oxidase [Melissococcus sp. OM08-11BH]|uniref:type 1 glycerol-3-phosphate oxidase n=1 Tax=Melissococcus sp. OM08-11BH TaxID=2293110 RepID=UPI000E4D1666|nr:type 1 glycerol-3-phosphate oxidase [Melissococcus sp. OM08-11BH]RGI32278.1 type 1 glycerol-3-phosphate oxidase [Melissococcus sp. OM08-11BH]